MRLRFCHRALCGSVILLLSSRIFGQSPAATLVGEVRGPGHEVVRGASCRLLLSGDPAREFSASTDASGIFAITGLPSGTYTLSVSADGFQDAQQSGVTVSSGVDQDIHVHLLATGGTLSIRPRFREFSGTENWGSNLGRFNIDELPNARNIWSLLENQEPSTVTNRIDVGGLETGIPALFGAVGASWTENQYTLNGFNVTDSYVPGRPLGDPGVDDVAEFQVTSAAKPAWMGGSGVVLALASRATPTAFHSEAKFFYSGSATQSNNMDARLRRFGFPGPERLDHLVDGNFQAGGVLPWATVRWPAFVSISNQLLRKELGGFSGPIDVHVYRGLAELTPVSRNNEHLHLLYSGQHVFDSREDAALAIASSSTRRENDNFHQFQARWDKTRNPESVFQGGFGAVHAIISSGLQTGIRTLSSVDLPLMHHDGAAPLSVAGERTRYEGRAVYQAVPRPFAGTHGIAAGIDWNRSSIMNSRDALGGLEEILVNGAAREVIRWNTPIRSREHVQELSLFAQDAWRPRSWLSIPLGLRLETSSGSATGLPNSILWTSVEPRAGFTVALSRTGLLLRASWSRYGHLLQGRYLDFGNPSALAGEVFRWQDLNGDGRPDPQEVGPLLRVFGGRYSEINRHLLRPFTDEISVGLDEDFGTRLSLRIRFFRRDDHRLIALLDLGVPFSSYTPVRVLDPGNDGITGTADDATLTMYNENPSALGRDFYLLTNPRGDHASYKGFEIRLVKSLLNSWEFSASFTAMQTLAPTNPGNSVFQNDTGVIGSLYTNPNTLLFDNSRTYFDRAFVGKSTGYYRAPFGIRIGAVAKYYDGLPFGRLLFVDGFNQGPLFVRATPRAHPGGFQTMFNMTLDLRLAREFRLSHGLLSGFVDCFNCLNMNRNTLEEDLTGPAFQSRVPLAIESPRTVRLGLDWSF